MQRFLFAAVFAVTALCSTAYAADRAMIVLDASGSMWGQIDGKTKIEIARETLGEVLGTMSDDLELGLVAYGHREKGNCGDIEELVSAGADTRAAIADAANNLNPKGKTPLSEAVRQAAQSLRFTEDKATVILVTDGLETCNADPCAVANELESAGVDFTAHVVGFGLSEEEGRQVACLAENTGGQYIEASDAGTLADALTQTVVVAAEPEPEPQPEPVALEENVKLTAMLSEDGPGYPLNGRWLVFPMKDNEPDVKTTLHSSYGKETALSLEPGRYMVRYTQDITVAETIIEPTAEELLERDLILNAGVIKVKVAGEKGGDIDSGGRWQIFSGDKRNAGYGEGVSVVPAGEVRLLATLGKANSEESMQLAAGEIVEKELVAAIGVVNLSAVYAEGGPAVDTNGVRLDVYEAKKSLDGKRKRIDGGYGPTVQLKLPPADYLVRGTMSQATAETQITVSGGKATDVVINLNAGVLYAKAPGAYRIDIYEGKTDLQGKRKLLEGGYGEEYQITAVPGEYLVIATIGDNQGEKKEVKATVTAAERTEVTVE